jgi:hypothetical protein
MAVDAISFPGNTFLDMDCESSSRYEGKIPGTTSISGYSEEYREHQLLRAPLLNLALESTETLPTMPLDKIVERMRAQQQVATLEDNVALRDILGLSQYVSMRIANAYTPIFTAKRQGGRIAIWVGFRWRQAETNRSHLYGAKSWYLRRSDPIH